MLHHDLDFDKKKKKKKKKIGRGSPEKTAVLNNNPAIQFIWVYGQIACGSSAAAIVHIHAYYAVVYEENSKLHTRKEFNSPPWTQTPHIAY